MNTILKEREYTINGDWYAPYHFLGKYKSVINVELLNTTSSSGDWFGIFFQLINGTVYAIPFSQENNYPKSGYTLRTGNIFGSFNNSTWNENIRRKIIKDYLGMIMDNNIQM